MRQGFAQPAERPKPSPTPVPWLNNLEAWVEGNKAKCRKAGVSLYQAPRARKYVPYGGWPWKQAVMHFCRENSMSARTVASRMGLSTTYLYALFKLQDGWKRRAPSLIQALRTTSSEWQEVLDEKIRAYEKGR